MIKRIKIVLNGARVFKIPECVGVKWADQHIKTMSYFNPQWFRLPVHLAATRRNSKYYEKRLNFRIRQCSLSKTVSKVMISVTIMCYVMASESVGHSRSSPMRSLMSEGLSNCTHTQFGQIILNAGDFGKYSCSWRNVLWIYSWLCKNILQLTVGVERM
jgi:hypothetical protein